MLGPTVNIAARLTGIARDGTVLVDDGMREQLGDDPAWSLRRVPRTSVKGYSSLRPWALRRREEELTGLPYGTYKSPFVRAVTPSAVVKVEDDSEEEVDQLASDDPVAPGDGAVAEGS